MCVLESKGSSPGRQGFKMAVSTDSSMSGSIGGGIMEHKMVELCRSLLNKGEDFQPFIKHQVHRSDASDKSGMICSGEQTISFYPLRKIDLPWVLKLRKSLETNSKGILEFDIDTIIYSPEKTHLKPVSIKSNKEWYYYERLSFENTIYILGGGHVGLALSSIMNEMGFYVVVIDDRDALNTMQVNDYAHQREVIEYDAIGKFIPEGDNTYVVLVSFGYRTDKIILKQLISKNYRYLGMMGSAEKVKTLIKEMIDEGVTKEKLYRVNSPIGLQINSKTPTEIAISIAAQIVNVKNME